MNDYVVIWVFHVLVCQIYQCMLHATYIVMSYRPDIHFSCMPACSKTQHNLIASVVNINKDLTPSHKYMQNMETDVPGPLTIVK